jgi:hypothetical protein
MLVFYYPNKIRDATYRYIWLDTLGIFCFISGIPRDITIHIVWLAEYLAGYLLLNMTKYPAKYSNIIHTVVKAHPWE